MLIFYIWSIFCSPGGTDTPILNKTFGEKTESVKAGLTAVIPFKRLANPEEIAEAFAHLASEKASYITGHILVVDGGTTIKRAQ